MDTRDDHLDHVPLKYRCAAVIVTEESDRPPYVPPPIPKYDHAASCGCPLCGPTPPGKRL